MAEVICSINCHAKDSACVAAKLKAVQGFAQWLHVDVADGIFTFHKSWNEAGDWAGLTTVPTEVHLMVQDPLRGAAQWSAVANVKRLIVHVESLQLTTFDTLQSKVRNQGKSLMLAVNPETPVESLEPYLEHALQFQILAVHPGLSGQKFLPLVLEKISWIRSRLPNAIIEVDGGIDPATARSARAAGADILVSESYIFDSANPASAYAELAKT